MGEYMSNNQIYSKRPMHGVAVHRYLLQWRLIWSSELVVYHILPSVQKTWLSTFLTYNRNKEYTLCTGAVLTERLHLSIYLSIIKVSLLSWWLYHNLWKQSDRGSDGNVPNIWRINLDHVIIRVLGPKPRYRFKAKISCPVKRNKSPSLTSCS